jgi:TRAP transporter TAXI family solute receptor
MRRWVLGVHLRHLLAALVVFAFVMAIVSLALVYFFPAPPSTIMLATGPKGTSPDYFGQRYRERLARDHVNLELRETAGSVENFKLLQDPDSGIDAAFVSGGVSNGNHAPGLLSLGTLYNNAIWIFYHSSQSIEDLPQLKGKRIAVGPVGSATRQTAERILGPVGVSESTATFLPFVGVAAAEAMKDRKVDVVFALGPSQIPAVQALLQNPDVRLLSFSTAEAYTRIYPGLVRLTLPRGVLDLEKNLPPTDVSLLGNPSRVLVHSDLHPEIVYLLLKAMQAEHAEPGVFQGPAEFPKSSDFEYPLAESAIDFYKNGPSFMQRHVPLWLSVHIQRLIAVLATVVAVVIPLFHYLPQLYRWNVRRRLLYWYARLQALEAAIDANSGGGKTNAEVQNELQRIEDGVSHIRFPLGFSDQVYNLRSHVEIVRRRTTGREDLSLAAE